MADLEQTGLEFLAEGADAFSDALSNASDSMGAFEGVGSATADSFNAFEEIVTGALRRVGEIAIDFAMKAGEAVLSFAQDAFEGALDAEKGLVRLRGAITRAGDQAPITEQQALDLADSLKGLAGGSDDAVIAAEAMLLKFQDITKETFPDALQTALDLAAVLGTDAASAAEQLGRALGNPEQASRILRQAGVFLTDQEKEQIKTWMESGDAASAQAFILDKLATATKGAAQDMANTVGGQFEIFKETIADAGEGIATAFLPIISELFNEVIKPNLPLIESFADSVANIISLLMTGDFSGGIFDLFEDDPAINALFVIRDTVRGIIDLLVFGQEPLGDWSSLWEDLASVFGEETATQLTELLAAFGNLSTAFKESFPEMQAAGQDFMDWLSGAFGITTPELIDNITQSINTLTKIWEDHGDTIIAVISFTFKIIAAVVLGTLTLIGGIVNAGLKLISGSFDFFSAVLEGRWEDAWDILLSTVRDTTQIIADTLTNFIDLAQSIVTEGMQDAFNDWLMAFTAPLQDAVIQAGRKILEGFGTFYEAGVSLMDGLRRGIYAGIGWITDAIAGTVQEAINRAMSILQIHSPSKLTMELIGEPIGLGVAEGIMQSVGQVKASMEMLVSPAMTPSQYVGATSNSSYVNSPNYNLNVNSNQGSQGIVSDFGIMQAMAA